MQDKKTRLTFDSRSAGKTPSPGVAIYVRVSTEEQRERQTIAMQKELGERYCVSHSLQIRRIYADDGVSGTVPLDQRPEGQKLLEDARQGRFSELLIYNVDRLGRETRLILNAINELQSYGVRLRGMT